MNQDQQPPPWWKDNRLLWTVAALTVAGLVITTILGYLLNWEWTGLVGVQANPDTRLAWDWLELLIIPVLLGAGALWFNQRARKGEQEQRLNELRIADEQRQNELRIADEQRKEDALQRYLDTMQGLILEKGLRGSKEDAEIRDVARARTLAVLRSLDGVRKGQVARFLHEADLIGKVVEESGERQVIEAIIDLRTANLSDADLDFANLSGAYLSGAELRDADLDFANLSGAYLRGADLSDATLDYANLRGAELIHASLYRADLISANLNLTILRGANLRDADLSGANLLLADLRDADLSGARCTNKQLAQVQYLIGATLPDGTKMTKEAWEEFKKRYR